jgi:acyl-CoA thioesterase-2
VPIATASVAGITTRFMAAAPNGSSFEDQPITRMSRILRPFRSVLLFRGRRSMSEPRPPRDSISEMLAIRSEGSGVFSACLEGFWGAAAPGDLLARATLAGSEGRGAGPGAIHALFLRVAPPDVALKLACERLSVECTRVAVREGDARVAEVQLRFGPASEGLSYQSVALPHGLPAPEDLPSEAEQAAREGWAPYAVGPIESRRITPRETVKAHEPARWLGWLRPRVPLGDDPGLHAAALALLAEYRSHWAVERRLGADFPHTEITLLDHALWVHRPRRWDDWWLVKTESDVGAAGRCLSRREIFARDGTLIASAAWQAALRTTPPGAR